MVSRKSFIITALIINLTICLTLCVVLFTDKDRNHRTGEAVGSTAVNHAETSEDILLDNKENEITELSESSDNSEIQSSREQEIVSSRRAEETTTKIIESQVASDTQPITYKNSQATTIPQIPLNQTVPDETTLAGTMVVINSSCNIRSSADVGGNVVGTANAGSHYRIEPSKCNSNWVAIYLDDMTLGYISTTFCSVN